MSVLTISNATDLYQRHERKLILVIVILLSLYLVSFAAKITWSFIEQPKSQTPLQLQQKAQSQSKNSSANANNINKLISQNLFGNAAAKPVVAKVQETTDVPETKLNLILSGVVSSDDPNRGAAIIQYRNSQGTYGVGDKIEGTNVTLDEIYVDRVIIKNRVTRETLMLDGIDFEEANKKRARDNELANQNTSAVNGPSNKVVQNQSARAQAVREARLQLSQEPASFTQLISLVPHRADGVFVGFKVAPGKKPQLFNSVGLKNGDIVVQLNGLDLSNLQQSQEAMTQLQEAETLQLEILRDGEYVSLDLDIPESSGNE
jgi:general secretion pathway protein C